MDNERYQTQDVDRSLDTAALIARTHDLEEEVRRLREEFEELRLIYINTMEHGTLIENELDEKFRQAEIQSLTDPLTGIFNRLKIHQTLNHEMERRESDYNKPTLIMFDIDHFKQINDTFGHHVGDAVLLELIKLTNHLVRSEDIFARWGGEEFMILTLNMDLEGNRKLAERIRSAIAGYQFPKVGSMTCSFGVAQIRDTEAISELIERVDGALYLAKETGRDRVVVS